MKASHGLIAWEDLRQARVGGTRNLLSQLDHLTISRYLKLRASCLAFRDYRCRTSSVLPGRGNASPLCRILADCDPF